MKISTLNVYSYFLALTAATPTPTQNHAAVDLEKAHALGKRATVSDKATVGFATQNGGTSGGSGGTVTTVSTLAQFTSAVDEKSKAPAIVVVQGVISGNTKVRIGSNRTIFGLPGAGFNGVGLLFRKQSNLILRNIVSSSVLATNGDGIGIENSTNVWIDHCEFYSALTSNKDLYDGLVDVTHGSDFVTISNTYFHHHWKTSLVGHSDRNGNEDKGRLRITYANNHWNNCGSRGPSLRFGTGHIYNSYYENTHSAINTRMGAQVLVENNVFKNVTNPITSVDSPEVGYAISINNDLGSGANRAPNGTLLASSIPYQYSLISPLTINTTIPGEAGAILTFAPTNGTAHWGQGSWLARARKLW
ncbi:polysaccharide lyase family 1 protein [Lasiosphaeris hirsuta]|uniref:Polysaccharide lyase family 1 protein n=1 Tax=Lasiosphaeris hirsuta TaxID=260670 RepID=A0AA40AFW6_9PEZI|nr:polysaccharide lyase family 1 protein [Lasiosphaeris hirsuta]